MNTRTYDLSVMEGATAQGDVRIALSFGSQGSLVTGTQKAAQYFILAFLTERGSVFGDTAFGTLFMKNARLGRIRTDDDVPANFNIAVRDIIDYQADHLAADTPDDEVITAAQLQSFVLKDLKLWLKVYMTTAAGVAREIILPVSSVPS